MNIIIKSLTYDVISKLASYLNQKQSERIIQEVLTPPVLP